MLSDHSWLDGGLIRPAFAHVAGAVDPSFELGTATSTGSQTSTSPLKKVERVRSVFPETWLWTNSTVGFVIHVYPKRCF